MKNTPSEHPNDYEDLKTRIEIEWIRVRQEEVCERPRLQKILNAPKHQTLIRVNDIVNLVLEKEDDTLDIKDKCLGICYS